jgi:hypothetical protein
MVERKCYIYDMILQRVSSWSIVSRFSTKFILVDSLGIGLELPTSRRTKSVSVTCFPWWVVFSLYGNLILVYLIFLSAKDSYSINASTLIVTGMRLCISTQFRNTLSIYGRSSAIRHNLRYFNNTATMDSRAELKPAQRVSGQKQDVWSVFSSSLFSSTVLTRS